MANDQLNIVVLLRTCRDPRPPARLKDGGHAIDSRGVRIMLNPCDSCALEKALQLKKTHGGTLTALAIGPQSVDEHLRTGLSMGADRAVRINDACFIDGDESVLSRILSRAVDILAADLICTGSLLEDRGFDPVFPLAAARSGIPCVHNVITAQVLDDGVYTLKRSDHGTRQRVVTPLPAALTFTGEQAPDYPGVDELVQALDAPIAVWGLPELGLSHMNAATSGATMPGGYGAPRPDPLRVITPDPKLAAFDRILSLLTAGVTARQGKVHRLSANQAADALTALFSTQGLLP